MDLRWINEDYNYVYEQVIIIIIITSPQTLPRARCPQIKVNKLIKINSMKISRDVSTR